MNSISKSLAAFIILIITISSLSLIMIKPANAQSTQTPFPEFSIKFVDGSYDVPATTSTDPFTGQTVTIPAQHVNNQTTITTIKDRTNLYKENNYGEDRLYYQIQMKGHYSQEWANIPYVEANPPSEYTVVTYAVDGNNAYGQFDSHLNQISSGGTADFRVQAQIWSSSDNPYQMPIFGMISKSDWSPALTITLTDGAISSSINTSSTLIQSPLPTPTPTPSIPEFSWLTTLPLLLTIPIVLIAVRKRLQSNV